MLRMQPRYARERSRCGTAAAVVYRGEKFLMGSPFIFIYISRASGASASFDPEKARDFGGVRAAEEFFFVRAGVLRRF